MSETVRGWGKAVADGLNPFTRLVYAATAEDGAPTVPYYQQEKVKEAALQSDYGCDSIYSAMMAKLETGTILAKAKTLHLTRALMLEGPQAFSTKISSNVGKFVSMATQYQDARKDSVEEHVRRLAQSIHRACQGDRAALHKAVGETDPQRQLAGQDTGAAGRAKSDFQATQEREAKLYKKRRDAELKARDVVVLDKAYEQFDSSLSGTKLVASAVQSAKKKFAPQELNNFAAAVLEHARQADVMAALDAVLKDVREPVPARYKALLITEYLVSTQPLPEAVRYFKVNLVGLQRIAQLTDTSPKAQSMVSTSSTLLQQLPLAAIPEEVISSPSADAVPEAPAPQTVSPQPQASAAPAAPPRTPGAGPARPQPVVGATNVNAAFGGGPAVDTMFGAMEVKRTTRARGASGAKAAAPATDSWGTGSFGSAPAAAGAPAAAAGGGAAPAWGTSDGWGGGAAPAAGGAAADAWGGGAAAPAPAAQPAPTQQFAAPAAAAPAPAVPAAAPAAPAPAAAGGNDAAEQLRKMQEMFAANMAAMSGLMAPPTAAPAAAPVAAAAPSSERSVSERSGGESTGGKQMAWGSSVHVPPPLPAEPVATKSVSPDAKADPSDDDDEAGEHAPNPAVSRNAASGVPPPVDVSQAAAPHSGATPVTEMSLASGAASPGAGSYADPNAMMQSPAMPTVAPAAPVQPLASSTSAASTAGSVPPQQPVVTMEMLQQLQLQMQQTQTMLARQQEMFAKMQALYMQQQQEAMARMAAGIPSVPPQ